MKGVTISHKTDTICDPPQQIQSEVANYKKWVINIPRNYVFSTLKCNKNYQDICRSFWDMAFWIYLTDLKLWSIFVRKTTLNSFISFIFVYIRLNRLNSFKSCLHGVVIYQNDRMTCPFIHIVKLVIRLPWDRLAANLG